MQIDSEGTALLKSAIKSQYHASLAMLRQTIEKCPDDLWINRDQVNAFWQTAYHTLYFTHMYLHATREDFLPWSRHQSGVQHEDGLTGPAEPGSLLPLIPRPYTRGEVLEYQEFCDGMVDDAVDAMDLMSPKSGFSRYPVSKFEHQIVNIRHIQIGAAQLAGRLRAGLNIGVDWVGWR